MGRLARGLGVSARLVPLGVALDRWPVRPPRARDTSRPARLLNISDVRPVKDHRTLLEAAKLLRERGRPFELQIPDSTRPLAPCSGPRSRATWPTSLAGAA